MPRNRAKRALKQSEVIDITEPPKSKNIRLTKSHDVANSTRNDGNQSQSEDCETNVSVISSIRSASNVSTVSSRHSEVESSFVKLASPNRSSDSVSSNNNSCPRKSPVARSTSFAPYQDHDYNIFAAVKNNRVALKTIVDEWMDVYTKDKKTGLIQLVQFFISSSGCNGNITPEMFELDPPTLITRLTQCFDEETGDYPLIMRIPSMKVFTGNYCEFIHTLVSSCKNSIVYDGFLFENLMLYLILLTDSQIRAFRHTATLAVLKIITTLIEIVNEELMKGKACGRQYEAELSKSRSDNGGGSNVRREVLISHKNDIKENIEELGYIISYMFGQVVANRYRDVHSEIRSLVIKELGLWLDMAPDTFVNDFYLKYIGWNLSDKCGDVRKKCLQALLVLYDNTSVKDCLDIFTRKFQDRITIMSLDKELEVAVLAIKLIVAIFKVHATILTEVNMKKIELLVYSRHRLIAQAAGVFLMTRRFQLNEDSVTKPRGARNVSPNVFLIKKLVKFSTISKYRNLSAYLVDALLDCCPWIKEWGTMGQLLLEDSMDVDREAALAELMGHCAKQVTTGDPPPGREVTVRKTGRLSMTEALRSEEKRRLTIELCPLLPDLLDKFSAEPKVLVHLISILQFFHLNSYIITRQENHFVNVLDKLKHLFYIHIDDGLLGACSKTLEVLCREDSTLRPRCLMAASIVTDACCDSYLEHINNWINAVEEGEIPEEEEKFILCNSLKKMLKLYTCHNLNKANLWDLIFDHLAKFLEGNVFPEKAFVYSIGCCMFSMLWSLDEMKEQLVSGGEVTDDIQTLRERQHSFMDMCSSILQSSSSEELKKEAFGNICDLLIFFSEKLASVHHKDVPVMKWLMYEPSDNLAELLNSTLQTLVFCPFDSGADNEEEMLSRRNLLSSYCKLIIYNVIPVNRGADVFKNYLKYYDEYGDIIKLTMSKCREMNKVNCGLSLLQGLQRGFLDAVEISRNGHTKLQMDKIAHLKELAKRFVLFFGVDSLRNRDMLTSLHRVGVIFAAKRTDEELNSDEPPPFLAFLLILAEFSPRLIKQDKNYFLKLLDKKIKKPQDHSDENWEPLNVYRNSLLPGEPDTKKIKNIADHAVIDTEETQSSGQEDRPFHTKRQPKRRKRAKLTVTSRRTTLPRKKKKGSIYLEEDSSTSSGSILNQDE